MADHVRHIVGREEEKEEIFSPLIPPLEKGTMVVP